MLLAVSSLRALRVKSPVMRCVCGQEVAAVDGQLSPRLQDAEPGRTERQVLPVRGVDQVVENGVVKDLPPPAQVVGLGADALVGGVDPGGDGGGRPGVVGADLVAVGDVFV